MPAPLKMITTRWDQLDGHTLEGYERTGGYTALRKALTMEPDAVVEEEHKALAGRLLEGRLPAAGLLVEFKP